MKTRIHAIAGAIGFLTILTFWTSTVISELFGGPEMIASVKQMILYGMLLLIPAMAVAGGSGMSLGAKRTDAKAIAKKKRMPIIAANGLLILVPSAFFLASKASAGSFDTWFYGIQALELAAGATNLTLMGLNIRDGLTMTGRIGAKQSTGAASKTAPMIEESDGGPLIARHIPHIADSDGEPLETKPVMALCRCGASKTKPFCDGTHSEIGFNSEPLEDRTPDELRAYQGEAITVHYNRLLCSHAGECGKLKSVFDPSRKPWIEPDNGSVEDIVDVITRCPSGALSYSQPGEPPKHAVAHPAGIEIEENGPFRVNDIPLATERLAQGACTEKYVLCRCGASKNKPYCDGSHGEIGWQE